MTTQPDAAGYDSKIKAAVRAEEHPIAELLRKMISYPSTIGNENELLDFLADSFAAMGTEVAKVPFLKTIVEDADYTSLDGATAQRIDYAHKYNIVAARAGRGGGGKSVILQAHADVVEAESRWQDAFVGVVADGKVHGRGACDDKGQIAVIFLALKILNDLGVKLKGDVSAQIVVEEEIGGNGALSLIKQGHTADGVVVLEPTGLQVHPANRGALWFRVTTTGRSVHMGRCHEGVNSIETAMEVIRLLRDYEKRLIHQSKDYPLFERYERPVQLNIGTIHGGVMPAMVPSRTVIEGGVGFLPNKSIEQIKSEVREAILQTDDPWLKEHFSLDFSKVHNDAYEISADHPLVRSLERSCRAAGLQSEVFGWNVSCDARLYAKRGKMPTVVFGAGDVAQAHAEGEHIEIREILDAATALALFLIDWCQLSR